MKPKRVNLVLNCPPPTHNLPTYPKNIQCILGHSLQYKVNTRGDNILGSPYVTSMVLFVPMESSNEEGIAKINAVEGDILNNRTEFNNTMEPAIRKMSM
jgi:hypothetical protein